MNIRKREKIEKNLNPYSRNKELIIFSIWREYLPRPRGPRTPFFEYKPLLLASCQPVTGPFWNKSEDVSRVEEGILPTLQDQKTTVFLRYIK